MAKRGANGRFQKTATRSRGRTTTAVVVAAPASPARRRSSPVVIAARARRRKSGGGAVAYSPVKSAVSGAAIGTVEARFPATWAKLPEIGGSRMPAAAAILHVARGHIPHGPRLAESAATIAGYELGKSGKLLGSISGGDDDF